MPPRLPSWTRTALLVALGSFVAPLQAEELAWTTLDGGGATSTDGFFALSGTFGQADAGMLTDGFYRLEGGFWGAAVTASPSLVQPPASTNVALGDTVTFVAESVGTPPFQYQWRLNGIDLAGETNATLTLSNISLAQAGSYTVVIVNASGIVVSDPARLGLLLATAPAEDHFTNRATIELTQTIFRADNRGATREPGEPYHAGKLGGRSVWYTWSTNAGGIATFRTQGSGFDTLLAVYTGKSLATLEPEDGDDDRGEFFTSETRFNVTAGTSYQIAVDGLGGRSGDFVVSWAFEPTPARLPRITSAPANRSVRPGDSTTFTVGSDDSGLFYQWHFDGTQIPGATGPTLTLTDIQVGDLGLYYVAITNASGRGIESQFTALEFGPVPLAVSHDKVEDLLLATGWASLAVPGGAFTGTGPQPGIHPLHAGSLLPNSFVSVSVGSLDQQTFSSTNSQTAALCAGCNIAATGAKYFGLEMQDAGLLVIDTVGSSFDTLLNVYRFESASGFLFSPCAYLVGCDDNGGPEGASSRLTLAVAAGERYVVEVAGVNGQHGSVLLNWQLCPFPSPFQRLGNDLFLVTATNLHPYPADPNYYWFKDGGLVLATNQPFLRLDPPLNSASTFKVVTTIATNGALTSLTNVIGQILNAGFNLVPLGNDGSFQLLLPGITHLGFQIEAAATPLTNCALPWHWEVVTNYTVSTQLSSLVLSFPAASPARFYRVRPPTSGAAPP